MNSEYASRYDSCSHQNIIGYSPLAYFVVGLMEVGFSVFLALTITNRSIRSICSTSHVTSYLLPVYLSVVIALIASMWIIGVLTVLGLSAESQYYFVAKWAFIRALSESLSIFLMHPGIGIRSARRSLSIGFAWTGLSVGLILIVLLCFGFGAMVISSCVLLLQLLIFYLVILIVPQNHLHRRPALNWYAGLSLGALTFQLASLLAYVASSAQRHQAHGSATMACVVEIGFEIIDFLQICFILLAFALDSRFWQGEQSLQHEQQG
jgi:hypothetical protein